MKIQSYQCDECGAVKKESNHWLVFRLHEPPMMIFHPWDARECDDRYSIHICGEACAAKLVSRQIAKWKEK